MVVLIVTLELPHVYIIVRKLAADEQKVKIYKYCMSELSKLDKHQLGAINGLKHGEGASGHTHGSIAETQHSRIGNPPRDDSLDILAHGANNNDKESSVAEICKCMKLEILLWSVQARHDR